MAVTRSARIARPQDQQTPEHETRRGHQDLPAGAAAQVLRLQRSVGNQTTCELLRPDGVAGPPTSVQLAPAPAGYSLRRPPRPDQDTGKGGTNDGIQPRAFPAGRDLLAGGTLRRLYFDNLPELSGDASRKTDFEIMRIWRMHRNKELYLTAPNMKEMTREMNRRKLDPAGDSSLKNPLDLDRGKMKTSGSVAAEVIKPVGVGGGAGAGYAASSAGYAAHHGGADTASNAIGPPGQQVTAGGSVGGAVVDAALLIDAGMTLHGAYSAHGAAKKRGDHAGVHMATGKAKQGGWGLAGGAASASASGIKIGSAMGSTAAGLAAATGGLGIVGGGLTAAQGIWKIAKSSKKLWNLGDLNPTTEPGRTWKGYITGREQRKIGVNALKVAAGALGIAAGVLFLASNPVGWAVGIAAMVVGGAVTGFKLFQKAKKAWKQRSAKKDMQAKGGMDELAKPVPGAEGMDSDQQKQARSKQVKELADKVAAESSQGTKHAAAMRDAVRVGDADKGQFGILMRDTFHAGDTDFSKTIAAQAADEERYRFNQLDLQAFDAANLMGVLNVSREEALSESGQDLLARKMSVSNAS
ncbi:MAG: hypothetical protein M3N98_02155 [Actinomycetota bacterium]|nr:hypothetical protein [Actinomycetota bacterium]